MKKLLLICVLFSLCLLTACIFENRCADCSLLPNTQYRINYPAGDSRNGTMVTSDEDGCVEYIAVQATDLCSGVSFTRIGRTNAFFASPLSINLAALPATVTLTGEGIDTTYGMPLVQYYDSTGNLVGSTMATTVASDNTWIQGNTPDLSGAYNGDASIQISNKLEDGTWSYPVGSAPVTVFGGADPPPDGGGGGGCYGNDGLRPVMPGC